MSWPPYANGGEAPHATIKAIPNVGIQVREHIPFDQYAKALMNLPGGVETNRRGVLQFELMGTCDPKHKGDPNWYYWPDADDVVLKALADYLRPIHQKYLIPNVAPKFLPYPDSYGNKNGQRFTYQQWDAFNGICGHQHVPENDHGDPGAFPIAKLIAFLEGSVPQEKGMFDSMGTVKNPATGEWWEPEKALWSAWTYAMNAARDAGATLAIVKKMASQAAPLTTAQIEAAAKEGAAEALAEKAIAVLRPDSTTGGTP